MDNLSLVASPALDREAVDQAVARGSELLKQGKLDEAQKAFRAALLLDGENARVLALLGLTHFRGGQFTQARPIYEELVERAPTDASHRLNLGLVYLKLGDAEKAIGSLEASRALDPSQGRAISYLGLAYARAGRYAEAYRAFLVAGQNDLAEEISVNLTAAERTNVHAQLQRGSAQAAAQPRTRPPSPPPKAEPAAKVEAPPPEPPPPEPPPPEPPPPEASTSGHSMPEIQIAKLEEQAPERSDSDPGIVESEQVGEPAAPAAELTASRMTDSLQFVMPQRDAVPEPAEGQSVLSKAVEVASPATAGAAARVGWGSTPPVPLSQLATEFLVRPDESDEPFEVTAGQALVIRVKERVLTRLDGVHVTGGELEYEPAVRRSRGHNTEERFDFGGKRMYSVSGQGYLIAVPGEKKFTAVSLDDDIFYVREDLVFAFEATLRWENGNVPGLRGKLPVVQFRGDGAVALRTEQALVRVKLPAQGLVYVDAMRLAGWIGRVIPRAVVPPAGGPMGDVCVECTGEGVVLIDPAPPPVMPQPTMRAKTPSLPGQFTSQPPPPPQPAQPVLALDLGLGDDDKI